MESDMETDPGDDYGSVFDDPVTGEEVRVDEHLNESESDWGTWPEPNRKLAIATRDGTAAEALPCLQQGGNPDDKCSRGFFINAAEHGKLEIVRHWLSFSKKEIDCDRNTYALQYACKGKRIAIIRYLLSTGVPLHPNSAYLWRAVKHRNDAIARLLLEYGNVDSHALFVVGENAKMAHCLVKYSCDVNVIDNKGRTPLHMACRDGHLHTAKALKGAYPSALDSFGWTPVATVISRQPNGSSQKLGRMQALLETAVSLSLMLTSIGRRFQKYLVCDGSILCKCLPWGSIPGKETRTAILSCTILLNSPPSPLSGSGYRRLPS
jgi:hypothetical protein